MLTGGLDALLRNLVSTFLPGNPGKIDFVFPVLPINHDDMDQVFLHGSIQALQTNRTEKIYSLSFLNFQGRVLKAGIIPDLRVKKHQSLLPVPVPDPEYDMVTHPQVASAMRTDKMIFHGFFLWMEQDVYKLLKHSFEVNNLHELLHKKPCRVTLSLTGFASHNPLSLQYKFTIKMEKNLIKSNLWIILAAGSIWGLTEFAFGLGLQKCAVLYTGAILTGLSFFWVSFVYSLTRKILPVLMIVAVVVLFKSMDALLLPVAWSHGSILNPIFAFVTIMVGFLLLIALFRRRFFSGLFNRIVVGAGSALVAISLFPLAGFVTGTNACVYASTNIPLSIYTGPVAIIISMITVPLGYFAAESYAGRVGSHTGQQRSLLARLWSPLVMISSLLIIALARMI